MALHQTKVVKNIYSSPYSVFFIDYSGVFVELHS